jgi:hypothetical protein
VTVMRIFLYLWNGLRQLIGLVLPIFAKARDFRATGLVVRWVLHVLVLVVILALLTALQNLVPGLKTSLPYFRFRDLNFWLPVLFLLLYALVWLGRWLWLVWMAEEEVSEFPDLDRAWEEAVQVLREADLDLQEVPLFLVLGRPAAGEEALFRAAQLPFTVKHAPPQPDSPLRVYANRQDGVFVTCAGASRLGPRAALLSVTAQTPSESFKEELPKSPDDDSANATIGAANNRMRRVQDMARILHAARQEGRAPAQMTEEERQRLRLVERADDPEEAQFQTARLQHLCRLIVRDRRPECPLNGILVLLPCAALRNDEDAKATSSDCQTDLHAAWEVFQTHCPLLALVCDLETVPGFPEFLDGYLEQCKSEEEKRKARKRRLGRRIGWGVDLDDSARQRMIGEQVQWIGRGMFPIQIFQNLLHLETAGREDPAEAVRRNSQLYRFLGAMRGGQKRLTELVLQGLSSKPDGPPLLGGCYLAATGRDPAQDQAFVAGVFQRLLDSIKYVSWTEKAVVEDAAYHRLTRYGYIALPIFTIAVVLLGVALVHFR